MSPTVTSWFSRWELCFEPGIDPLKLDGAPQVVQPGSDAATPADQGPEHRPSVQERIEAPVDVSTWDGMRFKHVKKLQDAARNQGCVVQMIDTQAALEGGGFANIAVKQMPNTWVRADSEDFAAQHPLSSERPWQDIGCVRCLNDIGFTHVCKLLGVFRDGEQTYVATSLASQGDLFTWVDRGAPPVGPAREAALRPIAAQLCSAVQRLHELGIVHGDLSMENVLLDGDSETGYQVKLIDFGMSLLHRETWHEPRGKKSYQAPEMHTAAEADGFLTDAFAIGVTLFSTALGDYPWLSTIPGTCKCFDFVYKRGSLTEFLEKRKITQPTGKVPIANVLSPALVGLLEGLLKFDPEKRSTLGELQWVRDGGAARTTVWEAGWLGDPPAEPAKPSSGEECSREGALAPQPPEDSEASNECRREVSKSQLAATLGSTVLVLGACGTVAPAFCLKMAAAGLGVAGLRTAATVAGLSRITVVGGLLFARSWAARETGSLSRKRSASPVATR